MSAAGQPGNLPLELTTFVGRTRLLAEGARRLRTTRLLTLTGGGGCGKTRLALRLGADLADDYRDGVWLVDLAALSEPELLDRAVLVALGILDQSGQAGLATLIDQLRDKQLLLILDNCEHLVTAVARLVRTLLQTAPEVRVLATSRQRLEVPGEHLMDVPPLYVGGVESVTDGPEGQHVHEAVRLLIDRAAAVGVELTPSDWPAAIRLCQRLDGIPLALELAAVHLGPLSVQEILDRMDNRFALLGGGVRYEQSHHQTLQLALDWSYELCTPDEQDLWRQLSVFVGGFDLAAAENVCVGKNIEALVTSLVRQSILTTTARSGRTRYRLLETVRQYGARLVSDGEETAALRQRHADYYRAMVATGSQDWCSPREADWMVWLRDELPNLRATLEYFLARPEQTPRALEIIVNLTRIRFWFFSGLLGEGRGWFRRALDAHPPTASAAQVVALANDMWISLCQGQPDQATSLLRRCQAAAAELDRDGAAAVADSAYDTHTVLGATLYAEGAHALLAEGDQRSIRILERACAAFASTKPDNPGDTFMAALLLAIAAAFTGDRAAAMTHADNCLRMAKALRADWSVCWALWAVGVAELRHGDPRRATALFQEEEARGLLGNMGDAWGPAWSLGGLAWAAAASGQHERAARLLGAAQRRQERGGVLLSGLIPYRQAQQRAEAQARRGLGAEEFAVQHAIGAALPYSEIVEFALTPQPDAEPSGAPSDVLTAREYEIARLVAAGRTSKNIAAMLVISARTVDRHVQNILDKLEFRSRAQIAAWIAERGAGVGHGASHTG
ncbi:AAA family ATPase [Solihabitans fulvus]|uniref:AAA family ATPase n=1 Tax=Solihabitans fulvus TaxID=1892852 RepID=A0A5B2XU92_9PSEU|nr:LuxR C-terminal-related transcriptional regulator [Solihabitans fulvus]KAA2267066.1 AAA family ATPase [Solihabitans fulvus]